MLQLTRNARLAAQAVNKEPQIVLEIDGVPTKYGARIIYKAARLDDGLLIDGTWKIGGGVPIENQESLISFEAGTSTNIRQQLEPDKGVGSTVSSMQIALVDQGEKVTRLITPGEVVDDVLGRKAKVWLGFAGGSVFPDDYLVIFRGIIDDIVSDAGVVTLNLAHPDQKKRQEIYQQADTELDLDEHPEGISDSANQVYVIDPSGFQFPAFTPSHAMDPEVWARNYLIIDDEYMAHGSPGGPGDNRFGVTRARLGTTAAAHAAGSKVKSFNRIYGNAVDIALALMLSTPDSSGYYSDILGEGELMVTSVNVLSGTDYPRVQNAFWFYGMDIEEKYGIRPGDKLDTAGFSGSNLIGMPVRVVDVVTTEMGSYVVVDGTQTLTDEAESSGWIRTLRSKYDVLPDGLGMSPDEVDIEEHERIKRLFLSSFELDLYIKDSFNGREFLEKEIYLPAAAYSLPRKARASIGYHIGPIPGQSPAILNETNITNAPQLRLRRSISKNFYNTIVHKLDEGLRDNEFAKGVINTDADSLNRIKVGRKTLVIESKGLRSSTFVDTSMGGNGINLANSAATRMLNRYKFAAEYLDNVRVTYGVRLSIEIGDVVLVDLSKLNVSNTKDGTRVNEPRLFEVVNKTLDIKGGAVSLNLVDTNYSTQNRYGLISPASKVKTGLSQTQFVIKPSFGSIYGNNEFEKWERFTDCMVKVRSSDFSRNATRMIVSISGNTITLDSALGFTPQENDIMEMANYNDATAEVKALYTFMSDGENDFADGGKPYRMI